VTRANNSIVRILVPPPEQPKPRSSLLPVVLTIGVTLLICTALFFLTSGFFGLVIVMGGAIFAFAAVHYVLWGWWLSKMIRDEVDAEDQAALPPSNTPFTSGPISRHTDRETR
jgi:hypothetical protein